jgi:hypothetical protein
VGARSGENAHGPCGNSLASFVRRHGTRAAKLGRFMQTATSDRRLLDKLIREISRAETQATEHAPREAKRIGDVPPVLALRDVATHAAVMRSRFVEMLSAHEIRLGRTGIGATLATLRHLVVDRVTDAERSFRTALLDLRHGVELVKLLREIARREVLFGVIRWCDDWLGARRTLVARVEAQLEWFPEQALMPSPHEDDLIDALASSSALPFLDDTDEAAEPDDLDWHADRTT